MALSTETDRQSSFKQRVKQERELEILQAAREVFAERGFAKASIDDIAERVGIGKGTVYLHFASKEDILVAAMRLAFQTLVDKCRKQALAQPTTVGKLQAALRVLVDHRYANERLVRAISTELPHFLAEKQRVTAISDLRELLTELVVQGQVEGAFNPQLDPQLAALSLLSLVFVAASHLESIAKEQLVQSLERLYFHGITQEVKS
ncbi:MAG TPA: helix-turn-helix domain-containing protein [Chloroflexota bacterium]|nr:helix-turn-helix domain-containing protein [Chloroflexota bacterium]